MLFAQALTRTMVRAPMRASLRPALLTSGAFARGMSTEPPKKPAQQPQLILTDDILERAGMDSTTKETLREGSEGAKARQRKTTTDEKRERTFFRTWMVLLGGAFAGAGYMARDWDSVDEQAACAGEEIANGYTPSLMYERLRARFGLLFVLTFEEPAYPDLLPPPPPEPYKRPLTLVVALEDLLVHSEWSTKSGWRTAKRPGLDYFLGYLLLYYEIVVFLNHPQAFSEGTVAKLDPLNAFILYPLFREHARLKDSKLVKDLLWMNRDLGKMVLLDVNTDAALLQPENAIILPAWDGKMDDGLIKLIPFLEYLATLGSKDVRPILNTYKDRLHIPEEFARREALLRQEFEKKSRGGLGFGVLGAGSGRGRFPLDLIREQGQLQYQHFMKYLDEHRELIMAEKRKMEEQRITLGGMMRGEVPTPQEETTA